MRFVHVPLELAETHYAVHVERPFYAGLIEYITSGPVVASGRHLTPSRQRRNTMGATNPVDAARGIIPR